MSLNLTSSTPSPGSGDKKDDHLFADVASWLTVALAGGVLLCCTCMCAVVLWRRFQRRKEIRMAIQDQSNYLNSTLSHDGSDADHSTHRGNHGPQAARSAAMSLSAHRLEDGGAGQHSHYGGSGRVSSARSDQILAVELSKTFQSGQAVNLTAAVEASREASRSRTRTMSRTTGPTGAGGASTALQDVRSLSNKDRRRMSRSKRDSAAGMFPIPEKNLQSGSAAHAGMQMQGAAVGTVGAGQGKEKAHSHRRSLLSDDELAFAVPDHSIDGTPTAVSQVTAFSPHGGGGGGGGGVVSPVAPSGRMISQRNSRKKKTRVADEEDDDDDEEEEDELDGPIDDEELSEDDVRGTGNKTRIESVKRWSLTNQALTAQRASGRGVIEHQSTTSLVDDLEVDYFAVTNREQQAQRQFRGHSATHDRRSTAHTRNTRGASYVAEVRSGSSGGDESPYSDIQQLN